MGAGKSTVARMLSEQLGWPLLDTDRAVEQRCGRTIPEIFAQDGEASFRAAETRALEDVARLMGPIVVSVGGGAVRAEVNRRLMRAAGTVVWLRAQPATLAARVGTGRGRPLLAGSGADVEAELARLAEERRPLYEEVADIALDVDGMTSREVARLLVGQLSLGDQPLTSPSPAGPSPAGRPPGGDEAPGGTVRPSDKLGR